MSHFLRKSLSSFLNKLLKTASPTLFCCRHLSHSHPHNTTSLFSSTSLSRNSYTNGLSPTQARFWASQTAAAAAEPSTSDGLTVEGILSNNWTILDENDGDWKSHVAAIAQSINLIKRRLQWKKLKVRLSMLSVQLNKEDPVRAGKINREHGSLLGKMKEVNGLERELLEHIEMIKLAQEENDEELELNGEDNKFRYGGWWSVWWTGTYSMVLSKAAFFHKKYLSLYTNEMPSSIREYVTKNRNCEDIAMSFLVANATGAPPLWVKAKIYEIGSTGISSLGGHSIRRSECVNIFTAMFGRMPLVYTSVKAVDSRNVWFW